MLTNKNTLLAIVSVMVLGLLVTGVVGLVDGSCDDPLERDTDGNVMVNHNDEDYTPPEDGSGYGASGEKNRAKKERETRSEEK